MASLNFKTSLWLDTKGFRKDIAIAQRALNNFKNQISSFAGAVGAGLGFATIVSNLKETVTELSVANATLENVSKGQGEYANNLEFVQKLSKTYKQDIISLTDGFAKFHAASEGTNISLSTQKDIFKALTQASTFFHLSAEKTSDVMLAVEQMMSKGKVSAEELRRQLGNNLPGAVNTMYQAYQSLHKGQNITFGDFEKLMSQGRIYSEEVLPAFAERLNEITKNYSLDSLVLASTDLKNTWTELASSTGFEDTLKGLYNIANKVLTFIKDHLAEIKTAIITLSVTYIGTELIGALIKLRRVLQMLSTSTKFFIGGTIISGMITLISHWQSLNKEANSFLETLNKIKEEAPGSQKLEDAQKALKEANSFLMDEGNISKYNVLKKKQQEVSGARAYSEGGEFLTVGEANFITKFENYQNSIHDLVKTIQDNKVYAENEEGGNNNTPHNTPSTDTDIATLEKALQKYHDGIKKLDNDLANGALTASEYAKKAEKLTDTTWQTIAGFDDFEDILKKLPKQMQEDAKRVEQDFNLYDLLSSIESDCEDTFKDLLDSIKDDIDILGDYEEQKKKKQIGEDLQNTYGVGGVNYKEPTRDTTFDYKKTRSEMDEEWVSIFEDEAKEIQEKIDELKEEYGEDLGAIIASIYGLDAALSKAKENAKDMEDLKEITEIKEDLKNTRISFFDQLTQGTHNLSTALSQLTDGWKTLQDTLEESDSDWEKFLAVLNEVVQTFDTLQSIIDGVNSLVEVSNLLTATKTALTKKQADANLEEGAAAGTAAAAEGAKSVAGIPIVGAAMAVAAVASIVGVLMAAKGKFANGGIVNYGSSSGDKTLARVNKGEGILTAEGVKNLNSLYNSRNGGNVKFIIHGKDLVGTLNNYSQQRKG